MSQSLDSSFFQTFRSLCQSLDEDTYRDWLAKAMFLISCLDQSIEEVNENLNELNAIVPVLIDITNRSDFRGVKNICSMILNMLSHFGIGRGYEEEIRNIFYEAFELKDEREDYKTCKKEEISPDGMESFLDICRDRNERGISVCICDEYGRFSTIFSKFFSNFKIVFMDQLSETLFENKKDVLSNASIFGLMIPFSCEYLRRKNYKNSFFPPNKAKTTFSYTVYSQNARKKYMKMINKSQKSLDESSENSSEKEEIKGIGLFYKFLKCLTSRVRRMAISINRSTVEELLNNELCQEYPFYINASHPFIANAISMDFEQEIIWNVIMVETRIAKHIQKFNYLYMKFDSKIKSHQGI